MSTDAIGRPMEILLVEDSLPSARLTMGALKRGEFQHRLTWLTDGRDALEFVRQTGKYSHAPRPDLVLLDLGLPGLDGREVLGELKADPEFADIPVVVLTGSNAEEDRARAEELSVDGYMTKPVDFTRFVALVQQLNRFWHADMIVPATV
jgi:two-component system, chemotaxis family, response regulator Rcp1